MLPFLFLLPLISGIWSADKANWLGVLQTKLPLLFLPFCTRALIRIPANVQTRILYAMVTLSLAACGYSLYYYFLHHAGISQAYLRAEVLPVLMDNDHIRFSWALLILYLFLLPSALAQKNSFIAINTRFARVVVIFLALFFHLLASKTGLIGFYLLSLAGIAWYTKGRKRLSLFTIILLIPLFAWLVMPTFRNRLKFVRWDFQHYSRGGYTEGLSDAPRIISYQAGTELLDVHPFLGVGFGDIPDEMNSWYAANAIFLKSYERILPANEFLFYALGGGWLSGLLMFFISVLPFFHPSLRKNFCWIGFHLLAFTGFLYEIGLELQYGVFLYGFCGCWLYWHLSAETVFSGKNKLLNDL